MGNEKIEFGKQGENIAGKYLLDNGYSILESNWRTGHLEVDIIAKKNDEVIFVEVKSKKNSNFSSPESSVTKLKQKNIIRAANYYMIKHKINKNVRFDIITIVSETNSIEHLQDAYSPQW